MTRDTVSDTVMEPVMFYSVFFPPQSSSVLWTERFPGSVVFGHVNSSFEPDREESYHRHNHYLRSLLGPPAATTVIKTIWLRSCIITKMWLVKWQSFVSQYCEDCHWLSHIVLCIHPLWRYNRPLFACRHLHVCLTSSLMPPSTH